MTTSRSVLLVAAIVGTDLLAMLAGSDELAAQAAAALVTWFVVPGLWVAATLANPDRRRLAIGVVSALTLAVLLGGGLNGGILASLTIAGVGGGWLLQRQWRVVPLLAVTSLLLIPNVVLPMAGTSFSEVATEQMHYLREQYEVQIPESMSPGDREAALTAFDEIADRSRRMVDRFWPSLVLAGLISQTAMFLLAGWGLARATGAATMRIARSPLAEWRAPFASVWVLIGGLAMSLVGRGDAAVIGWNLVAVAGTFLVIQGLGVQVWLVRRVLPLVGQILFWVLGALFFAPALIGGGALIGLADQWMDLRRLRRPPENDDRT